MKISVFLLFITIAYLAAGFWFIFSEQIWWLVAIVRRQLNFQ
nr:Ecr family regulatory small membrane protein [Klebsiella variicola]